MLAELKASVCSAGAYAASSKWEGANGTVLIAPDGGPLLLNVVFSDGEGFVGLELVISGELLGMPSSIRLEPEEHGAAENTRRFIRQAFEAACSVIDPLYGGVDFEWRIPEPRALTSGARLAGDLYWSYSLDTEDGELASDLEGIYGVLSAPFARGALIPAGGVLESTPSPPWEPLAAGRAAAKRLAQTLQRTYGIEGTGPGSA
jgi:hypothetical protein